MSAPPLPSPPRRVLAVWPRARPLARAILAAVGVLLACAARPASADIDMRVQLGWEGKVVPGKWVPIYVTLSDPDAPPQGRHVRLDLVAPRDNSSDQRIHQALRVQRRPETWVLLAPLAPQLEEARLTVSDFDSRQTLVSRALEESASRRRYGYDSASQTLVPPNTRLVAVVGRPAPSLQLLSGLGTDTLLSDVEPGRLPVVARGYDALDALVLNEPGKLAPEAQQAIAQWVRAGGLLVVQSVQGPAPASGPLADLLPAFQGELRTLTIPAAQLASMRLPERFGLLAARELRPLPGTTLTPLIEGQPLAVAAHARRGLGRVVMLSFDATSLVFRDSTAARELWNQALGGAGFEFASIDRASSAWWNNSIQDNNQAEAMRQAQELLGDIKGVGRFDFSYVAIVMLAMMVLVGPVDYFVLRALGRQPWTWVTTGGWVGLITLGAIYIGHLVRSGDLHHRTLSVVDEADGRVVARQELAAVYAPRTTDYGLKARAGWWWEPASADTTVYRHGLVHDYDADQDLSADFNHLRPFRINVWNLRFLSGETFARADGGKDEPAVIEARLSWKAGPGGPRLVGELTNRSGAALKYVTIRSRGQVFIAAPDPERGGDSGGSDTGGVDAGFRDVEGGDRESPRALQPPSGRPRSLNGSRGPRPPPPASATEEVAPGATVRVRTVAGRDGDSFPSESGHAPTPQQMADPAWVIRVARRLNTARNHQVERLLSDGSAACVEALSEGTREQLGVTPLDAPMSAVEKHWRVVRAVVTVAPAPDAP